MIISLILTLVFVTAEFVLNRCGFSEFYVLWKALCSMPFVIYGTIRLVKSKKCFYTLFLYAGLIFSLGGDIAIELSLIAGMIFFALGHICYTVSFFSFGGVKLRALAVTAAVVLVIFAIITIGKIDLGDMKIPVAVYTLLISFVMSKSLDSLKYLDRKSAITLISGTVLFLISDFILLFMFFTDASEMAKTAYYWGNSFTYYTAQILIAKSIHDRAAITE